MRIGIFSDVYFPYISGVVTTVEMLKNEFERRGHEVYIVAPNYEGMKTFYESDNKVLRIPAINFSIYDNLKLTSAYPMKAARKIKKWDLDIIHINTEFSIGMFGRIISSKFNIPIVYTYHTIYEDNIQHITRGFFDAAGKKALGYITQSFCKDLKEIIAPGEKVYKLLKDKYKVKSRIHIVPNGIEIERFYNEKYSTNVVKAYKKDLNIKDDDFVVIYVGRVSMEKKISVLVNGMKDIVKATPKVKLLIVGDGPDKSNLEKLVAKYKIEDNVIFTGAVPWQKVSDYYQLGDVFATASDSENHSVTIIEAMAASLPTICIKDESFLEMVIDKANGRIFKNQKEYVKIIKELYNSPKVVEKMSLEARITSESYSARYFANKITDVYKLAISSNKGKNLSFWERLKNRFKKSRK